LCPPLSRQYYLPRESTLLDIISRYPVTKERKLRDRKLEKTPKGDWYKVIVYLVSSGEGKVEEKENKTPQLRESLVQISKESIRVIDAKTLFPMYTWDLDLLRQWKTPNSKTLIAYFGNGEQLNEAVVFKSSDVKQIVSLITSYHQNIPLK